MLLTYSKQSIISILDSVSGTLRLRAISSVSGTSPGSRSARSPEPSHSPSDQLGLRNSQVSGAISSVSNCLQGSGAISSVSGTVSGSSDQLGLRNCLQAPERSARSPESAPSIALDVSSQISSVSGMSISGAISSVSGMSPVLNILSDKLNHIEDHP